MTCPKHSTGHPDCDTCLPTRSPVDAAVDTWVQASRDGRERRKRTALRWAFKAGFLAAHFTPHDDVTCPIGCDHMTQASDTPMDLEDAIRQAKADAWDECARTVVVEDIGGDWGAEPVVDPNPYRRKPATPDELAAIRELQADIRADLT